MLPSVLSDTATIVVFAALVVLAATAVVASRRHEGQHRRSSDALWRELCRAHGLSRREEKLLRKAAESAELDPKSLIFVEPHLLRRLIGDATGEDGPGRKSGRRLLGKLYS